MLIVLNIRSFVAIIYFFVWISNLCSGILALCKYPVLCTRNCFSFFGWSLSESIIISKLTNGGFSISLISSRLLALRLWMWFKEFEFFFHMQGGVNKNFMQGNLENRKRAQAFYEICTKSLELQYCSLTSEAPYSDSCFSLPSLLTQVRPSVEKMRAQSPRL